MYNYRREVIDEILPINLLKTLFLAVVYGTGFVVVKQRPVKSCVI